MPITIGIKIHDFLDIKIDKRSNKDCKETINSYNYEILYSYFVDNIYINRMNTHAKSDSKEYTRGTAVEWSQNSNLTSFTINLFVNNLCFFSSSVVFVFQLSSYLPLSIPYPYLAGFTKVFGLRFIVQIIDKKFPTLLWNHYQ